MEDDYCKRTISLIGLSGLEVLKMSKVAVIGLGGVGSFIVEALVRSGIGNLVIVDHDMIEASNFNRQLPALCSNLGKSKAESIALHLLDINPQLRVEVHTCRYDELTSPNLINKDLDYVADAIDDIKAKVHLLATCYRSNIPIISSMGTAQRLNPLELTVTDIKNTKNCPLARKVRLELRKQGIDSGIEVVYSNELPKKFNRKDLGSMIFVPGSAGLLLAYRIINNLLASAEK